MKLWNDELPAWCSGLLFGIEQIDEQHMALFMLIDKLDEALNQRDRALTIHEILGRLEHWAKIHFAVEEALMGIMKFPDLPLHQACHQAFMNKLHKKKQIALKDDVTILTAEWLRAWLKEHIDIEDRKYADYFLTRESCDRSAA